MSIGHPQGVEHDYHEVGMEQILTDVMTMTALGIAHCNILSKTSCCCFWEMDGVGMVDCSKSKVQDEEQAKHRSEREALG